MEKKDLLSFNLGPTYRDFLESFKKELIVSLTNSEVIQESELEIMEDFYNFDEKTGHLMPGIDGPTDEITVCLKNRMSQVTFYLTPVRMAQAIGVNFFVSREDRSETIEDPLCWWENKTSEDLLDGKEFLETVSVWLTIGTLTSWAKSNFAGRTLLS